MSEVLGTPSVERQGFEPLLLLEGVTKSYDGWSKALDDVSLSVARGEFVSIIGCSGAGKSTFLKLILREEEATEGRVIVNGRDLSTIKQRDIPYLRRGLGVVFQDFRLIERKPFMRTSRWPCAPWAPPPGKFSGVSPTYWIWWG